MPLNETIEDGFLKGDERECCSEDQPPKGGKKPDCLDIWKDKSKKAGNELNRVSAKSGKAENSYKNASFWEGRLKGWIDDADKAQDLVDAVLTVLYRFLNAVRRMDKNTTRTVTTMKKLLCLVKDIFDELRIILMVASATSDKKGKLQELKDYIQCSDTLDDDKKAKAMGYVTSYEDKIKVVYDTQETVLKKLLDIFRSAELLALAIGHKIPPDDPDKKQFGLRWQVEELLRRMKGEGTSKKTTDTCICGDEPKEEPTVEPPCGSDVLKPPRFLPIKGSEDEQQQQPQQQQQQPTVYSDYCHDLETLYQSAKGESADYLVEMNKAKAERDAVSAQKNSLDEAIKAAEDAAKK